MRTTVTIDDSLYNKAADLADPHIEKSALLRECVKAYIVLQSARRLAVRGGTIPAMELATRCFDPFAEISKNFFHILS